MAYYMDYNSYVENGCFSVSEFSERLRNGQYKDTDNSCNDDIGVHNRDLSDDMDSISSMSDIIIDDYHNFQSVESINYDNSRSFNNTVESINYDNSRSFENTVESINYDNSRSFDNTVESINYDKSRSFDNTMESFDLSDVSVDDGLSIAGKTLYERNRTEKMGNIRMNIDKKHMTETPCVRVIEEREWDKGKYISIYSKGLNHDEEGYVDREQVETLLEVIEERNIRKLLTIKLGGDKKLLEPTAIYSYELVGPCNNSYRYSKPPRLEDDKIACDMTKLYSMSLTRDIPFNNYGGSSIIEDCCGYLNSLKNYSHIDGRVTPYNIFRGPMYGDLQGPYISQFLYRDINGQNRIKQKYYSYIEGCDFMKRWNDVIKIQNGINNNESVIKRTTPRYIITGRDLACYVKDDIQYETFYNTYKILRDMRAPLNPDIEKNKNKVEDMFVNFGMGDIYYTLGLVIRNSLLACWYAKWNCMFLRPEALALEVERVYKNNKNIYCISPELLINPVIQTVKTRNNNLLLPQVYPEGSPLNPSYPSCFATIAGACVTVLKFFFDINYEMDVYEPSDNGDKLINTGKRVTVGDELDKLASNISFGRNWAGVNYHIDAISGMKRGEKVAISCLNDLIHKYPNTMSVSFTRFNGKTITVSN